MEVFLATNITRTFVRIILYVGKGWFLALVIRVPRWEISTQAWHKKNIDLLNEIVRERHLVPTYESY